MSIGYPANKTDVDARLGGLTQQFRDTCNAIITLKGWADALTDQQLANLGYTNTGVGNANEVATLRSGLADLAQAAAVVHGTATQLTAVDAFRFAKWFVGVT